MSQRINIESRQFPNPSNRASDSVVPGGFKIVSWKVGMEAASFYVQAKGLHSGKPLSSPITNCWAVYSDAPNLREIAFSIYKSRMLDKVRVGSVIPFLCLHDYRPILKAAASNSQSFDAEGLRLLVAIDERVENMRKQLDLLSQYQTALAHKINHEIFKKP